MAEATSVAAGTFSSWLDDVRAAILGDRPATVPCGTCTACCTSSQFVHIAPDEVGTLAHVPAALLFPAPLRPAGHVVLGYDERGHCPMLVDGGCSIYEHRPRTCRTYDCRVFAAAGVDPDDDGSKVAIAAQVRRWHFGHPTRGDGVRHDAVRAAASWLDEHADVVLGTPTPSPTVRAVVAVEVHEAFLRPAAGSGQLEVEAEPEPAAVRVVLARRSARHREATGV